MQAPSRAPLNAIVRRQVTEAMNLSTRVFVLDKTGNLLRVPSSTFSAMISKPDANRLPQFASQRIRAAEAVVALKDRRPSRVVRLVYFILQFSEAGVLDTATLMREAAASLDAAYADVLSKKVDQAQTVIDAASRFIVKGGRWTPTAELNSAIRDAALGKRKCARL